MPKDNGWVNVKDRLPDDRLTVILFYNGRVTFGYLDAWDYEYFSPEFEGKLRENKVTHWMPLPASPKE